MMSLSDDKQADVIDAFNTTSRYLDDILNINNVYCLLLSKQQTFRWNFRKSGHAHCTVRFYCLRQPAVIVINSRL